MRDLGNEGYAHKPFKPEGTRVDGDLEFEKKVDHWALNKAQSLFGNVWTSFDLKRNAVSLSHNCVGFKPWRITVLLGAYAPEEFKVSVETKPTPIQTAKYIKELGL